MENVGVGESGAGIGRTISSDGGMVSSDDSRVELLQDCEDQLAIRSAESR